MFIFAEGKSREEEEEGNAPTNSVTYIQRKKERTRVDTCNSMDEFVLLWTEEDQICPEGRTVISDHTLMWQLHLWQLLSVRTNNILNIHKQ